MTPWVPNLRILLDGAAMELKRGNRARARELFKIAIRATEELEGPESPGLVPILLSLAAANGGVKASAEELHDALAASARAIALAERTRCLESNELGRALYHHGLSLLQANRQNEALETLMRAVAETTEESDERCLSLGGLVCAYMVLGDPLTALPFAEQWVEREVALSADDASRPAGALLRLGDCYAALGRTSDAAGAYSDAERRDPSTANYVSQEMSKLAG
jgi:tetratricopeptide (TPR) repeat protein